MSEVILLEWDCAVFHLSHFGGMDAQDLSCQALPLQEDDKTLAASYTQLEKKKVKEEEKHYGEKLD